MLCAAETSVIDVIHPSPPVQGVGALVGEAEGVAAPKQPPKVLLVQLHCVRSCLGVSAFEDLTPTYICFYQKARSICSAACSISYGATA